MDDALRTALDPERLPERAPAPRGAWRLAVRRALHGFVAHRGIDAAAALTFFTSVAAFPAALVFVSAFALAGNRERAVDDLVALAQTLLPDDVAASLGDGIAQLLTLDNPGIALAVGIVLLLWTASGYATAFGRAVNTVYGVTEGRPFWRFRGTMLLVAAALIVLATAIVLALLASPEAAEDILGRRGLAPVVVTVWTVLRVPLVALLAWAFVLVLVTATPNVKHPRRRWASVGSAFSILVWAIATLGYALYVWLIGAYGAAYGSIGVLLVALLWGYVTNLSLVGGVELDAEFVRLQQLLRGMPSEERIAIEVRDLSRAHWVADQDAADVADARRVRDDARPDPR